jgi:hypothetical protein
MSPCNARTLSTRRRGGAALAARERRHQHRPFGTFDRVSFIVSCRCAGGTTFEAEGAHNVAAPFLRRVACFSTL